MDDELMEINQNIKDLTHKLNQLEKQRNSDKEYFNYLSDLLISRVSNIPDFTMYGTKVDETINNKFNRLEKQILSQIKYDVNRRLDDVPTDLVKASKQIRDESKDLLIMFRNFSDTIEKLGTALIKISKEINNKDTL